MGSIGRTVMQDRNPKGLGCSLFRALCAQPAAGGVCAAKLASCGAHAGYWMCGAGTLLQDIMSKDVTLTTPDTTLDELKSQFGAVSGLPVVKSKKDKTLVGVVSKKDLLKRGDCVQDVRAASLCCVLCADHLRGCLMSRQIADPPRALRRKHSIAVRVVKQTVL